MNRSGSRNRRCSRTARIVPFALAACLFSPVLSGAAEWRVAPIRLDLGASARSGVITVFNEKPETLHLQMKAFAWTQDAEGKDRYEETDDLLFFPRIMIFSKAEERILRAGIKMAVPPREKAYRLFLEEIPGPRKTEGTNVAIAIRLGVPVFVRPVKEEALGEVAELALSQGTLSLAVRNTGNVHFSIAAIEIKGTGPKGEETFSKEIGGWYLLAGASRRYEAAIPREACRGTATIAAAARTDRLTFSGALAVNETMCGP